MQVIADLINDLGLTVGLPIIIFVFALILGAQWGRAFRAAVTIGVAFIGNVGHTGWRCPGDC
jgi:PTS system galactitol-specific IIC component